MVTDYYVTDTSLNVKVPARFRKATRADFQRTKTDKWQTAWTTTFIQNSKAEKFALEVNSTHEVVGLGLYQNVPEGMIVYVEYIESAPCCNPNITKQKKYKGVGSALLAYGIQLSIDYGYGGSIYLKAKTSELRDYYIKEYGAFPYIREDPFLLLIEGDEAWCLFSKYLREE